MSRETLWRWAPAVLLVLGATFTVGVDRQQSMPLRSDLAATLPVRIDDFAGQDITLSDREVEVAGVSSYVLREFRRQDAEPDPSAASFSIYVGYYDSQTQGKTIHSPKNCLPGAGWEALQSRRVTLATQQGPVEVNRYLLQRDDQQALVVYWYQGRGRVEANEYFVKAQLLRDAALHGRTEEALVRVVVPIVTTEDAAFEIAADVAARLVPTVGSALPAA